MSRSRRKSRTGADGRGADSPDHLTFWQGGTDSSATARCAGARCGVDTELRPAGLALSLVGNLLFALGFGQGISLISSVETLRLDIGSLLPLAGPATALAAGYLLIRLAPRFGGGSFGVQFFVIGMTSLVGAVHADTGVDRFVGFMIGGIFLAIAVLGLIAAALTVGWRHSLLHAGPVVAVRGGSGPQALNVGTIAGAIKLAQQLQGKSGTSSSIITVDALRPEQRQQVIDQIEALRSEGKISDAQYESMREWSGLADPAPDP